MTNETDDVKAVEQLGIARDGVVKELRKVINPLSPPCTMLSTTSLKKQIPSNLERLIL
jgi:hypothetical protein